MKAGLVVSHLAIAMIAFLLGRFLFASPESASGEREQPADPVAAFIEAVQLEETHARARALLDFFANADPAWATRLRAEVNQPNSRIMLDEIGEALFAAWWAKSDPAAALANVVQPAWSNRNPWVREVMRAWVGVDPARAAEAADGLPPNPDRGKVEATRVLVDHWWDQPGTNDPTALLALVEKLEVMPRAGAVQAIIAGLIERRGVEDTEKFIESIPVTDDPAVSLQSEFLARFGQALVDVDMEAAVRWAEKHGQGREGSGVLRHLAFSWGRKDGPTAMQWALNLPESPQRPSIILRVWLSFRETQPEQASEWLLAQEPTKALEPIFQRYVTGTASLDVKKALEIAGRMKDAAARERLLAAVGVGWMKTDPKAALEWLDSVELAPELEERVRQAKVVLAPDPVAPHPPG